MPNQVEHLNIERCHEDTLKKRKIMHRRVNSDSNLLLDPGWTPPRRLHLQRISQENDDTYGGLLQDLETGSQLLIETVYVFATLS